ncbi:putative zinc finger protein [Nocardiopsis sp. Huas11]|uniref:anti-sigma factor family protein n=1 Tax=Nocardiopsis sp. Huas11 TaxID=2183912 RepID=UPI000EAF0E7A|nr:zf-HC2 domain-containing protein [Nocardiopsis sp. Huas11]RKS05505.1 putative zinc finger protein [Nocardiopsis sp. Huas11]
MSTEHLGERLSALVDGELGTAEHERALIHLAKCEPCRVEADMMRRLKRRLTGLCEPEPDMDFLGRLSSLSHASSVHDDGGPSDPQGPAGPTRGWGFGSSPPLGSSRPIGGFPWGGPLAAEAVAPAPAKPDPAARPARAPRRRGERLAQFLPPFSGGRYAVAGFAVATALLGTAFVAGGDTEDTPVVEPRLSDYAVEHAVTSRQVPAADVRTVRSQESDETGSTEATR